MNEFISEAEAMMTANKINGRSLAIEHLKKALLVTADPKQTAQLTLYLAKILKREGRYLEAIAACKSYLAHSPEDIAALRLLHVTYNNAGMASEAQKIDGELRRLDPARALRATHLNKKKARESYLKDVSSGAYDKAVQYLIDRFHRHQISGEELESLISNTKEMQYGSHHILAIIRILKGREEKRDAGALCVLGCFQRRLRQYEDAQSSLEKAAEIDNQSQPILYHLRQVYQRSEGRNDHKLMQVSVALNRLCPDNTVYMVWLASLYLKRQDPKSAAALLHPLYANRKGDAQTYGLLIVSYLKDRDFVNADKVIEVFKDADTFQHQQWIARSAFLQMQDKCACAAAIDVVESSRDPITLALLVVASKMDEKKFVTVCKSLKIPEREIPHILQTIESLRRNRRYVIAAFDGSQKAKLRASPVVGDPTRVPIDRVARRVTNPSSRFLKELKL